MIRKIISSTNPIIRQKAKPIKVFDRKIKALGRDLIDTLAVQEDPEGVGLAACQIAKPVALFAFVDKDKKIRLIANPKIIEIKKGRQSKKEKSILEGCLSIPDLYGELERAQSVTIKYQNLEGKEKKETFKGFEARIIQHEIDHLNGILFTDRLLKEKKPLYQLEGEKLEEVRL